MATSTLTQLLNTHLRIHALNTHLRNHALNTHLTNHALNTHLRNHAPMSVAMRGPSLTSMTPPRNMLTP